MKKNFDIYDFIINDDEVLLLIYAKDFTPKDPILEIKLSSYQAILYRSDCGGLVIKDIPNAVLAILKSTNKILVCELSIEEDEDDTKIANAYEAEINFIP